jgi:hypothetical protein
VGSQTARSKKIYTNTIFPDLAGLLADDDGAALYLVQAASNYEADEWAVELYSASRDIALTAADRLHAKPNLGCVRLSEWGRWDTGTVGWIAFWWSDAEYVGQPPRRGYGILEGKVQVKTYYALSSRD